MKEPKLKFTYIGLDGDSINFDFIRLLELTEAVKGAFAYQYKQNRLQNMTQNVKRRMSN